MNLFSYLESRFTQLSLDGQKEFNLLKDSELKAVMSVMKGLRTILKIIMVAKVIGTALCIVTRLKRAPKTSKEIIEAGMIKQNETESKIPKA